MQHLGKYFKQSAKALEQQVAKEARFYGALIRCASHYLLAIFFLLVLEETILANIYLYAYLSAGNNLL